MTELIGVLYWLFPGFVIALVAGWGVAVSYRLIAAWRHGSWNETDEWATDPPPPPDPTWPTQISDVAGTVVGVVVGSGGHRVVIIRDDAGLYCLQQQVWAPDWPINRAAWFGYGHVGSVCDSLARARTIAVETLALIGETTVGDGVGQGDPPDDSGDR